MTMSPVMMRPVTSPTDAMASRAPSFPDDDARWEAVRRRDRTADGVFFYSVRTTGVYCQPSCAARLPLHHNVGFHETRADAERAGFRPCKRCRPDDPTPTARQTTAGSRTMQKRSIRSARRSGTRLVDSIAAIDWAKASRELDDHGCATVRAAADR
jgi:methylphosphotriester-DNA--protein-cysteine methyltransferase